MNRSIPRRLGESRQFRPLRQLARCVAERLWRRGVVQRWASEDELVDQLQQLGLFTGLSGVAEWPAVRDEFLATGFLQRDAAGLALPVLSADHARPEPQAAPAPGDEERVAQNNLRVSRFNWVRRHGGGRKGPDGQLLDPEGDARLEVEHDAQYRPRRPRGAGPDVTSGASSAPPRGPVTGPRGAETAGATSAVTDAAPSSLSPSPPVSTPSREGEGEKNSPETPATDTAREPGREVTSREVTGAAVTGPDVTTGAGRLVRFESVPLEGLSDAAVADLALEGLALAGPRWQGGHEDDEERAGLAAVVRARRYTSDDLRLAGVALRDLNFAEFYKWAPGVAAAKGVTLPFLLGKKADGRYPATQLVALVTKGQADDKRASEAAAAAAREAARIEGERRRLAAATGPNIPGPVKAADAPPVDGKAGAELLRGARKGMTGSG